MSIEKARALAVALESRGWETMRIPHRCAGENRHFCAPDAMLCHKCGAAVDHGEDAQVLVELSAAIAEAALAKTEGAE